MLDKEESQVRLNTRRRIEVGRKAVDAYRITRRQQHENLKGKAIHDNTQDLAILKDALLKQGYDSIQSFFEASNDLIAQDMGFLNKADFDVKATKSEDQAFTGKWQ